MKYAENYDTKSDIIDEIGVVTYYKGKRKEPLSLYVWKGSNDIKEIANELRKLNNGYIR